MKSTLIILGCVAYSALAVSTSIKEKLGQAKRQTLAEQSCSCTLGDLGTAGSGLPELGQAVYTGSTQSAAVSQGQTVSSVPDTQYSEACQQAVCECHEATHQGAFTASRTRTYVVNGTVEAEESDIFASSGTAARSASGSKKHQKVSVLNNVSGSGSGAAAPCVSLCTTA